MIVSNSTALSSLWSFLMQFVLRIDAIWSSGCLGSSRGHFLFNSMCRRSYTVWRLVHTLDIGILAVYFDIPLGVLFAILLY